jgi:hypothetical protein
MKTYFYFQLILIILFDLLILISIYSCIDPSNIASQKQMNIEFSQIIITLCNLIVGSVQLIGAFIMIFYQKYRTLELVYYFIISIVVVTLVWLFSGTGYFELFSYETENILYWSFMGISGIIANLYLYKVYKFSKS